MTNGTLAASYLAKARTARGCFCLAAERAMAGARLAVSVAGTVIRT